jgi:Ser/Thr protein kinase RdoA (MazF antagonist)
MMAKAQERIPSDEEMRKLLKPNPTADQVLAAVQKSFVREGQSLKIVQMLESYDDRNYWVDVSGTSYLVKVHNGVESLNFIKLWKEESAHERSVIHLQNTIMEHLNRHEVTTNNPVPPMMAHDEDTSPPTAASIHSLPVVSEKHSPCQLVVRLLTWVPGRPMSSFPMLPLESIVNVGRFLGHFSAKLNLLNADQLEASHRFHQWDGENTAQLTEWVHYIQDEGKRSMITSIIDAFQKDLLDSGDAKLFRCGLIHGDFNDANILFNEDFAVSGVLDFGDSVHR